jgi:hypothetical protein
VFSVVHQATLPVVLAFVSLIAASQVALADASQRAAKDISFYTSSGDKGLVISAGNIVHKSHLRDGKAYLLPKGDRLTDDDASDLLRYYRVVESNNGSQILTQGLGRVHHDLEGRCDRKEYVLTNEVGASISRATLEPDFIAGLAGRTA